MLAVPLKTASVDEAVTSPDDECYESATSPDNDDALLAQELHAQEFANLAVKTDVVAAAIYGLSLGVLAVPPTPASADETVTSPDDEYYETATFPDDEDARLAHDLHAQEVASLAAETETRKLHEQDMAAASAAAQRDRQAQARRAAEEAASEALVQELQEYEAYGPQAVGSARLQSRLQEESDAEVAMQMQQEESALPSPAAASRMAAPRHDAEAHTIRRHLFAPSARLTGATGAASSALGGAGAAGVAGGSYASAATEWPRNVFASSAAPAISLPLPRPSHGSGASRRLQLVVDGANVGWAFGGANGDYGFSSDGMLHCVEYWRGKGVRPEAIAVVLHSRYYAPDDAAQRRLEALGVLNWSPIGHDDDLFLLQVPPRPQPKKSMADSPYMHIYAPSPR